MSDIRVICGRLLLVAGLLLATNVLRAGLSPLLPALSAVTGGDVYALYVQDEVLFIGGDFTAVDGASRNGLAAIDIATLDVNGNPNLVDYGRVTAWNPDLGSGGVGQVFLPAANGKTLYVGGSFATVGVNTHSLLAEIDIDSDSASYAQARSWDPMITGATVNALAWSADGSVVYVGGDFSQVSCDPVNLCQHLTAIDRVTAQAMPWYPEPDGPVHSVLVVADDSRLYVGGEFSIIGGSDGRAARAALAAVKTSNAAALDWNAAISGTAAPIVYDMELSDDDASLTIAGLFDNAGGAVRANLARLDTATVLADASWEANTGAAVDPAVYVLDVDPSGHVLAGGAYTTINGSGYNHLAMLDADGTPLPWAPVIAAGSIRALAVDRATDILYVGGDFTGINGDVSHIDIAAFAMAPPESLSNYPGGFAAQSSLMVTLSCTDHSDGPCDAIYYTLDGTEPTTMPPTFTYSSDIPISVTTTLKFFAVDVDGNREAVHTELYTIEGAAPLTTASPGPGLLNGFNPALLEVTCDPVINPGCESTFFILVELRCDDGGGGSGCAETYYTLDGSVPTPPLLTVPPTPPTLPTMLYASPIQLSSGTSILRYLSIDKAGNVEMEPADSGKEYILDLTLPEIIVSHASGNYTPPLIVTVICDDGTGEGCAEIYYTTDGSVPTSSSIIYNNPIILDSAAILRVQVSDVAGNSGSAIVGIYSFTDPEPLSRSGSGSGSVLWLPLMLLPLVFFRRRGVKTR